MTKQYSEADLAKMDTIAKLIADSLDRSAFGRLFDAGEAAGMASIHADSISCAETAARAHFLIAHVKWASAELDAMGREEWGIW